MGPVEKSITGNGALYMSRPLERQTLKDCCYIHKAKFLEYWGWECFLIVFGVTDPAGHGVVIAVEPMLIIIITWGWLSYTCQG